MEPLQSGSQAVHRKSRYFVHSVSTRVLEVRYSCYYVLLVIGMEEFPMLEMPFFLSKTDRIQISQNSRHFESRSSLHASIFYYFGGNLTVLRKMQETEQAWNEKGKE